ncbi:MAG: hypothetical protein ABF289_04925 [Clostridiales bacterium]
MDKLKKDLILKMENYFSDYALAYQETTNPLLNLELAYINFAKTKSMLFKTLYMSENLNIDFQTNDLFDMNENIRYMNQIPNLSKFSDDKLKDIFFSWYCNSNLYK